MNKKNNKGFTLLELLISIFILTTVIFLGYKVINKSTIDIKNQGNINKGQLTVNDMNEYLTKDLEKASNVVLESKYINQQQNIITNKNLDDAFKIYSGDKTFDYKYKIFSKEGNEESISATYQVNITKKDENNYKYTIVRTDEINKVSITFINDEIIDIVTLDKKIPFEISLSSPYKVSLGYNGKDNKFVRHEFTVDYRLQILPPTIDEILPPPGGSNNNMKFNTIGFWTADSTKKTQDNLYTWVSSETEIIKDAYADQQNGKNDNFNIEGYVKYNNNTFTGSYIGYNEIKSDTEWQGQVKDISIGSKKIIDIYIYVSKDTKLKDFKIESNEAKITIDKKTLKSSDGITLEAGWHSCKIELNNNKESLLNFKFTGKLSIDKSKVSTGYAYVAYQKEDYSSQGGDTSDLDGDLIYEITRNDKLGMNPGQTLLTTIPKIKKKDGKYEEIYTNEESTKNDISVGDLLESCIHILLNKDSGYIQTYMEKFPGKQIFNNNMYKDLTKIKEIVVKCDENTKLYVDTKTPRGNISNTSNNGTIEKISDNECKVKLGASQTNTYIYFDISKYYDTDEIPDGLKFKVSFTFIE